MRLGMIRRPGGRTWQKLVLASSSLGLAGLAFCGGRFLSPPQAAALPPIVSAKEDKSKAPIPAESQIEDSHRAVAYIFGTEMISRADLANFLIAREGTDKLEYLVNKRIIQHACKGKGIEVTLGEVDAALAQDLKDLKITQKDLENRLLKEYRKTLYEWKEDVIWPKLAMTRLCRDRVSVTAKDLQDAFEAYYGDKVEGRIILFPKGEEKIAMKKWDEVRKSEEAFSREARSQASPSLAATGGKIRPISRHSTGNDELEREVFSLKPGEVSRIVGTPEGSVIFKCDRLIPADKSKKLEEERPALGKEIMAKKIQQEMPRLFKELREQAQPKLFLQKYKYETELLQDISQELQSGKTK